MVMMAMMMVMMMMMMEMTCFVSQTGNTATLDKHILFDIGLDATSYSLHVP